MTNPYYPFDHEPTAQAIFDYVLEKITVQGKPSLDGSGCRYRTVSANGSTLCCAAGMLIPDDVYDREMEGRSVRWVLDSDRQLPEYMHKHADLIISMQHAHDGACCQIEDFVSVFREMMARLAEQYCLKMIDLIENVEK